MRLTVKLPFLVLLVACGSDPAEPPTGLTERLPGPCSSTNGKPEPMLCTMTYDGGDRLVAAECEDQNVGPGDQNTRAWTLTYDGDALVELGFERGGIDQTLVETWTFGASEVTFTSVFNFIEEQTTTTRRFEPDLILPRHPFELFEAPTGEHALLYHHARKIETAFNMELSVEEFTFTFDAPLPSPGTRTRTRDDNETVTFTYDDQGRLTDGFVYDGDLVVESPAAEYVHDEHGNLLERVAGDDVTNYDYACWE